MASVPCRATHPSMGKEGFVPSYLCARGPPVEIVCNGAPGTCGGAGIAGLREDTSKLGPAAFALLTDLFLV